MDDDEADLGILISGSEESLMKRLFAAIAILFSGYPSVSQQPSSAAPPKPAPKIVYVRAGHLFDGAGDHVRENMVIAVQDDRIQSVGAATSVSIPAGATVIDLSKATVLPGGCLFFLLTNYSSLSRWRRFLYCQ